MSDLFDLLAKDFAKDDAPVDPVEWTEKVLGGFLWSKQREIVRSVMENKLTAVRSAHSTGKSYLAALIACWWVSIHPPGTAFVATTAPTSDQVHAVIWEYIRRLHQIGNLPGEVQLTDKWLIGGVLVAQGRKPQDYNQQAFQGMHRPESGVLVILDEACGINKWLWTAADVITTGPNDRILAIGNPDDPASTFADVCKPGSEWNKIRISAFDTPNFTDEEVPENLRVALTQAEWVERHRRDWGESHPYWTSKVLAEFPEADEFAVIPQAWVREAQERWIAWDESGRPEPEGRKILGVDVARYGRDKTVIAHRRGDVIKWLEPFQNMDTEMVADFVNRRMDSNTRAVVDVVGIGAGVFDKLRRQGLSVQGFNAGARTDLTDITGENGFASLRTAGWWRLREALDPSRGATLCLPPHEDLAADLISPRWNPVAGGKVLVESKEDVAKRLGRSTDFADAVIMAMWIHGGPVVGLNDASFNWTDDNIDGGALSWEYPKDMEEVLNPDDRADYRFSDW